MSRVVSRLRFSEKVLLAYFAWSGLAAVAFQGTGAWPRIMTDAAAVILIVTFPAQAWAGGLGRVVRNWAPVTLTLPAYWQADVIGPAPFMASFDAPLVALDRLLRCDRIRDAIAASGWGLPLLLELAYLLIYVVPLAAAALVYVKQGDERLERFSSVFVLGTFAAYALLPFFPARSPLAFYFAQTHSAADSVRRLNLWLLDRGGLRESLPFPSGHIAAAAATSFAVYQALAGATMTARLLLAYTIVLSVATVYGRYHYAADVLAGWTISGAAALAVRHYHDGAARQAIRTPELCAQVRMSIK
ncbi:MAG: phosphatase PAP2 family protein [Cyanobacteria bacterium]|nr:phosphatase PAP2 family protein [Cyanobacteriota bacterium]